MCKQAILTEIKNIDSSQLSKVIETILKHSTKTERSGLGYFFAHDSGIFGEKSLNTENFVPFTTPQYSPWPIQTREEIGTIGPDSILSGPLICHGRTSTNEISLRNTHPLSKGSTYLVHNGVVNNNGPKYSMDTTNDTEHLIHYFKKDRHSTKSIEKFVTGYYAFLSYDIDSRLTHIVRDNIAPLYSTWISSIESYFFATTESILIDTCKDLSWNHGTIEKMQSDCHLVFSGNDLVSMKSIKSLGYGQRESIFASNSLGKSLPESPKKVSESYVHFLDEVSTMGPRDELQDSKSQPIDVETFAKMPRKQKEKCTLYRADGSEVTAFEDTFESCKKQDDEIIAWANDDTFLRRA